MKTVVLLVALFALCAFGIPSDQYFRAQFAIFQQKYKKAYSTEQETNSRFEIFKVFFAHLCVPLGTAPEATHVKQANLARAEELQKQETGTARYGMTKFSDLSSEEFRQAGNVLFTFTDCSQFYLMPKSIHANKTLDPTRLVKSIPDAKIPADGMDWRDKGAITNVYNQEQCGSWTEHAYQYVIQAGGQDSLKSYPYTAADGTCRFKKADIVSKISKWSYVTQNRDENAMLNWVTSKGPLSVCVDAESWSSYQGGVLRTCGKQIDHCVQVTGYSTVDNLNAWHVRNSWGTDWGVNGYIYVERGKDVCAIAEDVTVVTCA